MNIFKVTSLFIALSSTLLMPACGSPNGDEYQVYGIRDAIKLSKALPSGQRAALSTDLAVLERLNLSLPPEPTTLRTMGIGNLANASLTAWLGSRVAYVKQDQKPDEISYYVAKRHYAYPFASDLPTVEEPKPSDDPNRKGVVVMSNIGAAFYYAGKLSGSLIGLEIDGKKIPMTSPRVGILQMGEGYLLPRLQVNKDNPAATANSLNRLAVLFHEARHSDGHGKSLGFFHALCPEGHDFANINACDRNLNGPYSVGAVVTKEFMRNCATCTVAEKEVLKVRYLDSMNRVIRETVNQKSSDDAAAIDALKATIEAYELILQINPNDTEARRNLEEARKKLKELEDSSDGQGREVVPSTAWDATPEGSR